MTGSQHPLECGAAREAMSAHLDGEQANLVGSWLAEHLAGCEACREWHAAARSLHRRTRLTVAPSIGDLADRVLAEVAADRRSEPSHPARRYALWARIGLVVLAAIQLWVSLPILLLGRDPEVTVHPAHELGSFGVALAAGFLIAAWRPAFARGMHPLVGVVALLLILTASEDLIRDRTTLTDEAPHLLSLAGFLLLGLLARNHPPQGHLVSGETASSQDVADPLTTRRDPQAPTAKHLGDGPDHTVTGSDEQRAIA